MTVSKSQRKREAEALKKLGAQLVALSPAILATFPLTEELHQAVLMAKTIKSHGALKRQLQLIGKILREVDNEAIINAYQALQTVDKEQVLRFKQCEQWRERLLVEGEKAKQELLTAYPQMNETLLTQLVQKAATHDITAKRALFRFLREYLS